MSEQAATTGSITSATVKEQASWAGRRVRFTDPHGISHHALVTTTWGMFRDGPHEGEPAGVNLVYVSADEAKTDQYGRQLERSTSVVHKSRQFAHGMFFECV